LPSKEGKISIIATMKGGGGGGAKLDRVGDIRWEARGDWNASPVWTRGSTTKKTPKVGKGRTGGERKLGFVSNGPRKKTKKTPKEEGGTLRNANNL